MRYLLAYDICCPKRLRRVADLMLRHGTRTQKSVFSAGLTPRQLDDLFSEAETLIDVRVDLVQAWQLAAAEKPEGRVLGPVHVITPACVVYGGEAEHYYVTEL